MLDPWIIEEIRRREDERRRDEGRSHLELPLEHPRYQEQDRSHVVPEREERGVTVIDI